MKSVLALTATMLLLWPALDHPAFAVCSEDPVDLLPSEAECVGVVPDGAPLTAYNLEELYEIINGGAQLYATYGFQVAAFQNYLVDIDPGTVAATLGLFHQETPENAQALFHDPQFGVGEPIEDWPWGGEARLTTALFSIEVQFYDECYVGSVVVVATSDEAIDAARCLAESVCAMIHGPTRTTSTSWGSVKAVLR